MVLVADILKPFIIHAVQQAVTHVFEQIRSVVVTAWKWIQETSQKIYWNWASFRLMILLGSLQLAQRLLGDKWWLATLLLLVPGFGAFVLGIVGDFATPFLGRSILDLIAHSGGTQSDDYLNLLSQNFWNLAFRNTDPHLLRILASQIEDLYGNLMPNHQKRRPWGDLEYTNPDGTLNVSAQDVFLLDKDGNLRGTQAGTYRDDGTIELDPSVIQSGPHSLISGNMGEQVTMARVGSDEYAFGVDGLDPENMGNSPNGIVSVIDTAYFDPNQNKYYQLVKERFGDYLRNVPPGSKLNFVGHSMGAGMLMILLNDPEIQQKIKERGYDVHSVTTYGMVRPTDPNRNDVPPDTSGSGTTPAIFSETKVRHYVDPDDKLAMNVGGGHEGRANVKLVDDGEITGPVEAHTTYYRKDYKGEPLPFTVDPKWFKLYIRGGELPLSDPTPPPANMAYNGGEG